MTTLPLPKTKSVLLKCKLFPPRTVAFLPPDFRLGKDHSINCNICEQEQIIRGNQKLATECEHLVRCNECSDYQIEKLYRCHTCCKELLGSFPPPCNPNCQRLQSTLGAVCNICKGNLTKDCTLCKSTLTFKQTRQILRNIISVFVVHPTHLPESYQRPCSHYSPCKFCSVKLCKARKKSAICSACRKFHVEKRRNTVNTKDDVGDDKCISSSYDVPSTIITSIKLESLIYKTPFLPCLFDNSFLHTKPSTEESNIVKRTWRL
uniref:Uncharacterized protein n=1 Tax=Vannella robusta TaxID=1487602 RepID=A0A7S4HHC6_9EUKA|mmetsp:Transcript_10498/g.12977  ORF Transcript_10498/g.12977 Transcript_10498/m.12977 type:complete len:263 (+) Transcript_10498:2-790(+)